MANYPTGGGKTTQVNTTDLYITNPKTKQITLNPSYTGGFDKVSGYGDLSGLPLPGVNELFGGSSQVPTYSLGSRQVGLSKRIPTAVRGAPTTITGTAGDAIRLFVGATPAQQAQIQQQMWQAGLYSSGFKPTIGKGLQDEDITAFKDLILGFSINPAQKDPQGNTLGLNGYLNNIAQKGVHTKAPLVTRLTDPAAIKTTLQDTAQKLYGSYLPDNEVANFVTQFQGMEANQQAQSYASSGFNPDTGQQDMNNLTAGSTGTTVVKPDLGAQEEQYIRTQYPNQVAATQFGNALQGVIGTLAKPGV